MIEPQRVIEKNYLIKVLTLAGVPKVVTFTLTWLSFPLLLRALGPESFGTLVFIGAALALFETAMDFGISSASGKAMAEVRAQTPWAIRGEFFAWARLQILMVAVGFGPMLLGAYLMIRGSPQFQDVRILWIAATTVLFSVGFNFLRANLHSILSFKFLAVLEITDSVSRSLGFLVVAYGFPTVFGLALAGLFTAATSTALATGLMIQELRQYYFCGHKPGDILTSRTSTKWTVQRRLAESLGFLWLRLASRLFSEGPNLLLGRFFGSELVGILAGTRKLIDLLTTPYLMIGNALMVRVPEVARQGRPALRQLMEQATDIAVTSVFLFAVAWILLHPIGKLLFPGNAEAARALAPLLFLIPAISTNALCAPLSDFCGGLTKRNLFLSAIAGAQIGGIYIASQWADGQVAVLSVVGCQLVLSVGYVFIAQKVLQGEIAPPLKKTGSIFLLINLVSLATSALVVRLMPQVTSWEDESRTILQLTVFLLFTLGTLASQYKLRRCFLQLGILRL